MQHAGSGVLCCAGWRTCAGRLRRHSVVLSQHHWRRAQHNGLPEQQHIDFNINANINFNTDADFDTNADVDTDTKP